MDFVIIRFLMKLFNTDNTNIVQNCPQHFDVELSSRPNRLAIRDDKFEKKLAENSNSFCDARQILASK